MGTWGTDISENDKYMNLEIEFFELYNEGVDVETTTEKIVEKHNENLNSDEDSNNFWLAIADFQWQCKSLNREVLKKVKGIAVSKCELELWKELESTTEDIKDRKNKLNEFITKISSPKKRAKRRIKKKLYNSIFKKGDLIVYKLENGNYGGSLVIKDECNTEFGLNELVITNISSKEKPTFKTFKNAKIQYTIEDYGNVKYFPSIFHFYTKNYKEEVTNVFELEVIKNIPIIDFDIDYDKGYFKWKSLRNNINPSTNINAVKLKKWIKNTNWLRQWFYLFRDTVKFI